LKPAIAYSILVDLDGTLADCRARHHLLQGDDPDLEDHSLACGSDPVIEATAALVRMLAGAGYKIVLCSGRSEVARAATLYWLDRNRIPFNRLILRAPGDRRSNAAYKVAQIRVLEDEGFRVVLALDDYHKTADALIDNGVPTILLSDRHQGPVSSDAVQSDL
jgi:hypothetical protein